jgi:hypothetical protein
MCYLLLSGDEEYVKVMSAVNQRFKIKKAGMRIYITDELDESDFGDALVIALNGVKGWYKPYKGNIAERDIAEWMDGVKMGEGKKVTLGEAVKILGSSKAETDEAETVAAKSTDTPTEGATDDGVKEVFGDEKVRDEL